jgi:hypothetical protein
MGINTDVDLIAVFIFYKIATGVQAKLAFHDDFKHCNCITFDGSDWIMLDFDHTGLLTRKIKCPNGSKLINSLSIIQDVTAVVVVNVQNRHKSSWRPFWVRSCNEVCRYATGVNIGFTFNPVQLYRKLLNYRHKRNYEVLYAWRRQHGIFRGRKQK